MSIEHPPHHKQARLNEFRDAGCADEALLSHQDNAPIGGHASLRGGDAFFAVLSPLIEEAARLQGDPSPRQEASDLLMLLEENARLRKLAVQLSNLLGDLPPRD
jgi:hypothetical protein